jgi:uncharacterized protein YndB with AHSA1/START domain
MAVVRERRSLVLPPERAFELWTDTTRMPVWVDGFGRYPQDPPEDWPAQGAKLVWESRPHGRGRVTERVVEHDPPRRFVTDVYDQKTIARQTVSFEPAEDGGAIVWFELRYQLTSESPLNFVTDAVFIRPRLRESMARTLKRFATEAAEEAALGQL